MITPKKGKYMKSDSPDRALGLTIASKPTEIAVPCCGVLESHITVHWQAVSTQGLVDVGKEVVLRRDGRLHVAVIVGWKKAACASERYPDRMLWKVHINSHCTVINTDEAKAGMETSLEYVLPLMGKRVRVVAGTKAIVDELSKRVQVVRSRMPFCTIILFITSQLYCTQTLGGIAEFEMRLPAHYTVTNTTKANYFDFDSDHALRLPYSSY